MAAANWLLSPEHISILSNMVTVIGLPIALIGLFVVARQMKSDRLAVSAGAIGDMRTTIMARIERLSNASKASDVKLWEGEFAEFANDLEMACAIYLDGQTSGRTGELAYRMIFDLLDMINDDEDLREHMEKAIHANDTFRNIRDFREKARKHA